MEWPRKRTGRPLMSKRPSLGPTAHAATSDVTPPVTCTTMDPALSSTPTDPRNCVRLSTLMSPDGAHSMWATTG